MNTRSGMGHMLDMQKFWERQRIFVNQFLYNQDRSTWHSREIEDRLRVIYYQWQHKQMTDSDIALYLMDDKQEVREFMEHILSYD